MMETNPLNFLEDWEIELYERFYASMPELADLWLDIGLQLAVIRHEILEIEFHPDKMERKEELRSTAEKLGDLHYSLYVHCQNIHFKNSR